MPCHFFKIILPTLLLCSGTITAVGQLDTSGLIAHWPFNGNLNDVTGKGHTAIATNTNTWTAYSPVYTPGINNNVSAACKFDTGYLMTSVFKQDLNQVKQFSICAVLKFDAVTDWSTILYRSADYTSPYGQPTWGAEISNAGVGTNTCFVPVSYNNLPYSLNERKPFLYSPSTQTGKWYYMVITYNGSAFKTYVNGALRTVYYKQNVVYDTVINSGLIIGSHLNINNGQQDSRFMGVIDDLRLYNRALSDSEIVHYPFSFKDTAMVLNMPNADSVVCSGNYLSVKYLLPKPFRVSNVFSVQLSDSNGSFNNNVQIGRDSTNTSGVINCTIPPNTKPGYYGVRVISTAPADTTLEYYINYHPVKALTAAITGNLNNSISYFPPSNGMCVGDTMTFSLTDYAGLGETPAAYQWQKNDQYILGANTPVFRTNNVNDMDSFRVILKSNHACWFGDTVASNYRMVQVDSVVMGFVSISVSPRDSICLGEGVTYYIDNKANAGNLYYATRWFVKNKAITLHHTFRDTFEVGVLQPNDTVYCGITSNETCIVKGEFYSNHIAVNVDVDTSSPKVNIIANFGSNVPIGTDILFTAYAYDTGAAPQYQWLKNSIPIPGANNSTFTAIYPTLSSNDTVSLLIKNTTNKCIAYDSAISNGIPVFFYTGISETSSGKFSLFPNPNAGSFTLQGTAGTEPLHITITDVTGRTLYNNTTLPDKGKVKTVIRLDVNVSSGIYFLMVSSLDIQTSLRFIVNK